MAEFERLRELEAAMLNVADGELAKLLVPAALASLGRFGRDILIGGFDEEDGFVPGTLNNHLLAFTSVEELEKLGLAGIVIPVREMIRFAADPENDTDGITINLENQKYSLSRAEVAEILDLIGEEAPEDEDPDLDEVEEEEEETAPSALLVTKETPGWAWLPEGMKLGVASGTELSEAAKNIFAHAYYYANERKPFALLSAHVVKFLDPEALEADTPEECLAALTEEAEDAMAESLGAMPDFGKYTMDDGMLAVQLFSGVWCFHDPADFDGALEYSGEPTFGTAITMRAELLAACEEGRVLAVAMPETE